MVLRVDCVLPSIDYFWKACMGKPGIAYSAVVTSIDPTHQRPHGRDRKACIKIGIIVSNYKVVNEMNVVLGHNSALESYWHIWQGILGLMR